MGSLEDVVASAAAERRFSGVVRVDGAGGMEFCSA